MRKHAWWFVFTLLYAGWFQWASWQLSTQPVKGVLVKKLEGNKLQYEYNSHKVYSKSVVMETTPEVWRYVQPGETLVSYGTYLPGVGFDPSPFFPDTLLGSIYGLLELLWLGLLFTWCWYVPIKYLQKKDLV